MAGKVRLNFGVFRFKVRLVLFWSGIWYGKLIFPKIIFKETFICLKNVIWIYRNICSGTPLARPPTGRQSIGRISRARVVAPHLHS